MRLISLLLVVLCAVSPVSPVLADKQSEQILDEMSSVIAAFECYKVDFDVESGGAIVADGEYIVDGNLYKLSLVNQDIYGDGELRYTIDNKLNEVVIESIDASIPMVVANPAQAFRGLKKSFDSQIVECDNRDNVCVKLTPKEENGLLDSAVVEIDSVSKLPVSAQYTSAGELLKIVIRSITEIEPQLPSIGDIVFPDGYEVIDLR